MREAHLRDLVAVAECGSVRLAAKRLGISEAAISKNLTALERSVGVSLLVRSAHGTEPTEHGRLVLRRARVIDAEFRKLEEELAALDGAGKSGHVSIGVSSTAEATLLPRAVLKFHEILPFATMAVSSGPPATTVAALRDGKVDFVIGSAPDGALGPDLNTERLLSTDLIVVARKHHPLAQACSLPSLAQCTWVLGARQAQTEAALNALLRPHGASEISFPVQRDSFNALLHLLMQSDFLAVVSQPTVDVFCATGLLDVIPVPFKLAPMVQHLITASARPLSPTAKVLADEFRRASRAYRR